MDKTKTGIDALQVPIKLSFPVINVSTFETSRAEIIFARVAESVGKAYHLMPFKKLPTAEYVQEILKSSVKGKEANNGLVIVDTHFTERCKANVETMPSLRGAFNTLESNGVNYVIVDKDPINEEFVYHIDLPRMDQTEIIDLIVASEASVNESAKSESAIFNDSERQLIANYALGLSYSQMKNVFTYCAYLKFKQLDYLPEIRKEKAHILRDVGLDVMEPVSIGSVGGLENLKHFLNERKAGWDKDLPVKGILLAGVPGAGKTLTAKAAADVLGTTLVRLDMGRFYSKYLGETERQFTRALHTIEQIAPVVVLLDEVEKFFGQSDGEHETSKRLLGTFLYWLQERKTKIFIVATSNRPGELPPELMRAGRWDRSFFLDLPSAIERKTIFDIHISKASVMPGDYDIDALVTASNGFTGAEIEQAIIDAQYIANAQDKALSNEIFASAIGNITPVSETRKDDINKIRGLLTTGFYPASLTDSEGREYNTRKVNI